MSIDNPSRPIKPELHSITTLNEGIDFIIRIEEVNDLDGSGNVKWVDKKNKIVKIKKICRSVEVFHTDFATRTINKVTLPAYELYKVIDLIKTINNTTYDGEMIHAEEK